MSPVNYPAGSGVTALPAPQQKTIQKRPRRKTEPGGNSQQSVSAPDKSSPLIAFSELCRANGWNAECIKFPCMCEVWDNRSSNSVVIWRGTVHHSWCVCEIRKMSQEEMERIIA